MSPKTKRANRRARRTPPASGRKPMHRISARDVSMTADELQAFHREFQPLFQRREQRAWSLLYLCGQLSDLERKTIEPMVLSLVGANPKAIRGLQQFIGQGEWESGPLLLHLQALISSWLGEEDGVVIVDGSGFPKQGKHSVGVAHQYCGVLGKIANCHVGDRLSFWEGASLAWADQWDFGRVREVILGGDGAGWIRAGVEEFAHATWQLDGFPLTRACRQAFGSRSGQKLYQALRAGQEAQTRLRQTPVREGLQAQRASQWVEKVAQENWGRDWQVRHDLTLTDAHGLGCMEGDQAQLLAARMKGKVAVGAPEEQLTWPKSRNCLPMAKC